MGKAERAAALTLRRKAAKVISNIRRVRRMLAKHPFDAKTFNAINGLDGSLEKLVGRTIIFDGLTESEKLTLRHDINAGLDHFEDDAFAHLREATVAYFKDIEQAMAVKQIACSEEQLKYLSFKKEAALEAFNAIQLQKGSLDIERTLSSLEQLRVIAEEVEKVVPDIDHDLEEPEYTEENHDTPDELPTEPDDDDDEIEDVELPDDDEDDDDDEPSITAWVKPHQQYAAAMSAFMSNESSSMEALGFTAEKSVDIVKQYMDAMPKYIAAVNRFKDLVDPEACTNDDLLKGSTKCYKNMDRIVSLIEKFVPICAALTETCEQIIGASDTMLAAQTTK